MRNATIWHVQSQDRINTNAQNVHPVLWPEYINKLNFKIQLMIDALNCMLVPGLVKIVNGKRPK